jgi:hypothetical protein
MAIAAEKKREEMKRKKEEDRRQETEDKRTVYRWNL